MPPLFGDLRDPMTEAEIEQDIRERVEADRKWREKHPLTQELLGRVLVVTDEQIRPHWHMHVERFARSLAEDQLGLILETVKMADTQILAAAWELLDQWAEGYPRRPAIIGSFKEAVCLFYDLHTLQGERGEVRHAIQRRLSDLGDALMGAWEDAQFNTDPLSWDQYGPDGTRCTPCGRRTYGDEGAHYCVHCGAKLPEIRVRQRNA